MFRRARTVLIGFVVVAFLLSVLPGLIPSRRGALASAVGDWSMFRHDAQHTGSSASQRPNANMVLWSFATSGAVESSPAVVGGYVYVASDDGNVYCLDALAGGSVWNFTMGGAGQHFSSPAVIDGLVYVGSYSGVVYCLNASTGAEVWSSVTGDRVFSSPTVVDGRVYVGTYDGSGVCCFDGLTGVRLWNYSTGGQVWSTPAVFDGRVYVGSIQDQGVYCVNASDGILLWSYVTGGAVWSSPAVVDGKVFVGSNDNRVYCFEAATGALVWNYTAGNIVESSPAVANGRVYVGSNDGSLYCLNESTGTLVWNYAVGNIVGSSPAFVDGNVYVGCYDNRIYCIEGSTGRHVWNASTGGYIVSSPTVVNARLFVGSADGRVYCFGWTASAVAPKFDLVNEAQVEFDGGVNVSYTYRNLNFTASAGTVWLSDEKIVCTVPLVNGSSGIPTGNLSEHGRFDINGDGDVNDSFVVNYVDNSTVEVDGVLVHAQLPPGRRFLYDTLEGYGIYNVFDKTSFQLGSKTQALHRVTFSSGQNVGFAEFGLDVTFRDVSSPCLQVILERLSSQIDSMPSLQLVDVKLNGTTLPGGSAFFSSSPRESDGQWLVDAIYAYPLGAVQAGDAFIVDMSIRGEPGSYLLLTVLNWSPDSVTRYKYSNIAAYGVMGTVHQSIPFGNTIYPFEVFTNCTVGSLTYDWRAPRLNFNTTLLGSFAYFWNVSIPQELLSGAWTVDAPSLSGNVVESVNGTHAFLYFTADASALFADFFSGPVSINGSWGLADTFPPRVLDQRRFPAGDVAALEPVTVSINASDVESGVANATLYYLAGNASSWLDEQMTFNSRTGLYEAVIPGQLAGSRVEFRMVVFDGAGNDVTVESQYAIPEEVWTPSTQGAAVAAVVTVSAAATVSALASAAGTSAGQTGSKLGEKIDDMLPSTVKKWLADSVSSKHKVKVEEKAGSRFLLTRVEVVSYVVTMSVLTLGFAYAKSESVVLMFGAIPLILATSIFTDFTKCYIMTALARHMGVWTEHKVWYLGLSLFAISTAVFKVPFSSPSKLAHHSPKMTKRLDGLLSSISVALAFVFAFVFFVLYLVGFTLVGSIGLVMCLTGVLFDTLPIPPMGGKGIFSWNKIVWLGLFASSVAAYVLVLFML